MAVSDEIKKWVAEYVAGWTNSRFVSRVSFPIRSGVFTPVVADAATGGNVGTAATSLGWYARQGPVVTINVVMFTISTGGMTAGNSMHVRGLPLAALSSTSYRSLGTCTLPGVTFTANPNCIISSGASAVTFQRTASAGATSSLIVSNWASGSSDIIFTITYRTN